MVDISIAKKMKEKKCKVCGEGFSTYYSFQKYCSPDCAYKARIENQAKRQKDYEKKNKAKYKKKSGLKKTGKELLKCKECGNKYERYSSQIKFRGSNFCSKTCKNKWRRKQKPKKKTLDELWSKIVKDRAGNKCEYCGKTEYLNSHHIFSRSNHSVRWDVENGVCLCAGHHVLSSFSAHKAPLEFAEWLKETRGEGWYDELRRKAKKPAPKIDYLEVKNSLEELNEYKNSD